MRMNDEVKKVLEKYPTLEYDEVSNTFMGTIEPFPDDTYELRIELKNWNHTFPEVFELGERIPNKLDRHIYSKGNFCFTTQAKEQVLLGTLIKKLVQFIEYILIPYLKNNSYYEIQKKYKFGEYSHTEGTLQGYKEILQIENKKTILKTLFNSWHGNYLKNTDFCYCESGQKLGKCANRKHQQAYNKFKLLSIERIQQDACIIYDTEIVKEMVVQQIRLNLLQNYFQMIRKALN